MVLAAIARRIFGSANDRRVKRYQPKVDAINALEPQMKALSDEQLKAKTAEFKAELAKGQTLDDLLVPAFAVVREAAVRALGMRHFDVQLIGGMVLNERAIAEMKTGEGKTLVATLPVYLNALTGKGVHVVTVNDYLARRDSKWMGQIYEFLGLSVGIIVHGLNDEERKASYACDVTYGTNNEFGFDYLRDNMKYSRAQMAQRGHAYAIVDEVDSILVDEARTPLIISGPTEDRSGLYVKIDEIIKYRRRRRLRARREAARGDLHRPGRREAESAAARGRPAQGRSGRGRHPLPRRERRGGAPPQLGAPRPQDVRKGQGLHRPQRRSRHHRRVHRPHDAGPALFRGPAPGAGGQGTRQDPAREPDAGLDHLPELLPPLQEARRHDRHGRDRGGGIRRHLRPRGRHHPDQRQRHPQGRRRRDVPHRGRKVRRDRVGHRATAAKRGQPVLVGTTSIEKSEVLAELLRKRGIKDLAGAQRALPRAGSAASLPTPACRARSPSRPTWPAAAPTSSSAAISRCASRRRPRVSRASSATARIARIKEEIADGQGARRSPPAA